MAKQVSELTVFVASPSDLTEERALLEEVIRELNLQWTTSKGVRLELVRWETHAYPGISSDPQAVINEQLGDEYDIFIGILWKKFGTPTPRADSGTEEEFDRAYARYKKAPNSLRIMIYFKTGGVDLSEIDPAELACVRNFQSQLGPKGTLFWEFTSRENFSPLLRMHLSRCVDDWGKKWGSRSDPIMKTNPEEGYPTEESEEEGFLDLIEIGTQSIADLGEQLVRIRASTETLGQKMSDRTAEIEHLRGNAIDLKVARRICNTAADNLESYATIMDTEVPIFAKRFMRAIDCYAKAAAMLPDFSSEGCQTGEQLDDAIRTVSELRSAADGSIQQVAAFRDAIASHPRMTTQYNRAKRHALSILDTFLKEMKSGSDRLVESQKLLGSIRAELPPKSTQ